METKHKVFEYRVDEAAPKTTPIDLEMRLNAIGFEGWELAGIEYGCLIFKRERHDD